MQQQQLATAPTATAPGQPIGYAPVYGAVPSAPIKATPSLEPTHQATHLTTSDNAKQRRWIDGVLMGGLVCGTLCSLGTWAVIDGLYSGKDIRALERREATANATAIATEQRALNAEATVQQWQQHAAQQQQTLDQVRELICR